MKDFYYQIKGQYEGRWMWPPMHCGKVSAENLKHARAVVQEEYGQSFPGRVKSGDMPNHPFLLTVREIRDDDLRTRELFEDKNCIECDSVFRVIDHYNNPYAHYKGRDFCSENCRTASSNRGLYAGNGKELTEEEWYLARRPPFIYQIKNVETGMSYVGKTTQAFTLRWYQHFYQGGDCKFHRAIRDSKVTDWVFSVVEFVITPKDKDAGEYLSERERYWIAKFNSIESGYNTAQV